MTRAHRRVERLGSRSSSASHDGVALGDPRPVVEQLGDRVQRREVDRARPGGRARAACATALLERGRVAGVAVEDRRATGCRRAAPRGSAPGRARKRCTASAASAPSITASTRAASATVSAKTETQSRLRQAGTTPRVLTRPGVGFRPTMLLKPAGHAAGAGGVGAERERHVAARDDDRRARARAAADAVGGEARCSAGRTASACRPGRSRTGRGWSCRRSTAPASISRCTAAACAAAT